uniref:Uncharacterized protein n=3 Tax=Canis lupus TaxID=9612 RepID=A0A8I3MX72_CANLF
MGMTGMEGLSLGHCGSVPWVTSPHCYLNSQLDLRQNGNGCALGVSGEASFG